MTNFLTFKTSLMIHELNNLSRLDSCEYARLEYWIFVFYHSAIPENFFREYFFSGIVYYGVPFSINFLSFSAVLGFRNALEQNAMSSSVSVIRSTRAISDFLT